MRCHNYAVTDWLSFGHVIVTRHVAKKGSRCSDSHGTFYCVNWPVHSMYGSLAEDTICIICIINIKCIPLKLVIETFEHVMNSSSATSSENEYEYDVEIEEPSFFVGRCTYDEILAFPNAKFLKALNQFEATLTKRALTSDDLSEATYRKRFFVVLKLMVKTSIIPHLVTLICSKIVILYVTVTQKYKF